MSDEQEMIVQATVQESLPEKFAAASAQIEDQIHTAIERISEANFSPYVDRPWAGKLDVIQYVQDQEGIEPANAEKIVDLAVAQLCALTRETQSIIERRKLIHRLNSYRQLALQAVREPKEIEVWKFKVKMKNKWPVLNADGKLDAIAVPVKRSRTKGIDPVAIKLLMEIEDRISRIHKLEEGGGDNDMTVTSFEQFDRDADGKATSSVTVSISQRHATKDINKLPPKAREIVERAVAEQVRRRKAVKATVIEGGSDGEGVTDPGADSVPDGIETSDAPGGLANPPGPDAV